MPQLSVNGASIYYEIKGKGHPLVFIHAGGMESSFWNAQAAHFSTRYQVITYDLRGHGRSSVPESIFSVGDCVDDLHHLINHLEVRQTYLAGISVGGYIALSFTLRCPEKVAALILAGANSGPLTDTVVKMTEEIAQKSGSTKVGSMAFKYIQAYEAGTDRPDLTGRLSEIRQPVLLIVGDQDKAAPPYISEEMHRRIANSQLSVLTNCGHLCNQEKPDIFNSIIGKFLLRIEAA